MANSDNPNGQRIAYWYRAATKAYTMLPYYLARGGHAFPPIHYYFEMTRRCNLRCAMCQYIEWLRKTPVSDQKEGELTTAEWERVIDEVQRLSLITFTGGEPLLREDFPNLLERAGQRARTHFITNGLLLDDDRVERVVSLAPKRVGGLGLNFIGTSLEGPPEIHDAIRGLRGAFERSTEAIRRVAETRRRAHKACPMVHVTSVIQAGNAAHLHEMPRIVKQAGADVLNLTLEIRIFEIPGLGAHSPADERPENVPYPRIPPEQLAEALRKTREAAAREGVELRTPDMPDSAIVDYYSGRMPLGDFRCGSLWCNLIVGAKGDIHPCWLLRLGNVRETSLRAIWNGSDMRAFRRRTRSGLYPACAGCCFLVYRGGKRA
ncbi:MAG TPA: radical SAM protein [Candidatus Hydrogenedentes bacterium]|nr:radical SAM protein [Candidatus Hydrogenedentota bacterium]HPC17721.1 radical SAM protein [Candidatus Hydrogenedentota bacterium]HRT21101.1 radical SAM protein [Candidatus Hydrogenedentota bacterium]HRT66026.1 radical SAM protein [Candidatus Hydrogenedentota bacterium]